MFLPLTAGGKYGNPVSLGQPPEVEYPDSDGLPMSDNTLQADWIILLKENLDILFKDDPNVFVACDSLWYPVLGHPEIPLPDALVAFGRPKGYRGSYQQWEEGGLAPQVVFEILSPGNRPEEMARKLRFYDSYGVEEYYLYDPDHVVLSGWKRVGALLQPIALMHNWVSPRLKIRFDSSGPELVIYDPKGHAFSDILDREAQREQEGFHARKGRAAGQEGTPPGRQGRATGQGPGASRATRPSNRPRKRGSWPSRSGSNAKKPSSEPGTNRANAKRPNSRSRTNNANAKTNSGAANRPSSSFGGWRNSCGRRVSIPMPYPSRRRKHEDMLPPAVRSAGVVSPVGGRNCGDI